MMEKLLLFIDSKKRIFRIWKKFDFFGYLACIYFRKCCLKENFVCI